MRVESTSYVYITIAEVVNFISDLMKTTDCDYTKICVSIYDPGEIIVDSLSISEIGETYYLVGYDSKFLKHTISSCSDMLILKQLKARLKERFKIAV